MENQFSIKIIGNSHILHDIALVAEPSQEWFCREFHEERSVQKNNSVAASTTGLGRAKVVYFQEGNEALVLKHYFRGGLIARWIKDIYFGFSVEKSRAFKECRLLKEMTALNLPVPVPVAAQVQKSFCYYRADLVTREIQNSSTLADFISTESLSSDSWRLLGSCVKKFHVHNLYHADLNARNILINSNGEFYLIDFDKSEFRENNEKWKQENNNRLKRSLLKFRKMNSNFYFTDSDWLSYLEGYTNI